MKELAAIVNRGVRSVGASTIIPSQATDTSWSNILARAGEALRMHPQGPSTPPARIDQLTNLLRLQVDLSRYQLKVELVSKVSESAVASLRKLQQNG